MTDKAALTINRDIEDIKVQVRREIDIIKDYCDSFSYRDIPSGPDMPFHLHRLRRALRTHYLAIRIRESTPISQNDSELIWDLKSDTDLW